jgi:AraC-like DNA-binding protein
MNPFILTLKTYNSNVEIHRHSAYQIVFTTDNNFRSVINNAEYQDIFGFLIKPHVSHLCKAESSTLNILNIEPYSPVGLFIKTRFIDNVSTIIFKNITELSDCLQLSQGINEDILKNIMLLSTKNNHENQADERITLVLDYIKAHYCEHNITPQFFADLIFLSSSRLTALFKQQTGSSLSKYLLWTRLRNAINFTLTKKEMLLTEIAYDTGFYDLPQLDKYMHEMFGVSPKALKKHSDLIQLY